MEPASSSIPPSVRAPGVLQALPSSELLGLLEELTGGAYFAVDARQNMVACSPKLEQVTGFAPGEVIGRHCLSAIRCSECLKTCGIFDRGWVDAARLTLFRKDGQSIAVRKSGRLVRDAGGRALGTIEMVVPEGEETRAESASSAAAAGPDADALLATMGRCYLAADDQMRILGCSRRLEELTRTPAEQLRQMTLEDLFGGELFGAESAFRAALAAGERREGWRAHLRLPAGEPRAVSLSAAPVVHEPGEPLPAGCQPEAAVLVIFRLEEEQSGAAEGGTDEETSFSGIIARSQPMQRIFRLIDQLCDNDASVLITGESGTGKELVARAIHDRSHRRQGPFVTVNCGALPAELLESELFGHVRGAFTGAIKDKPGRFELAEGGTLFLDEIGDLPLALQVKLLRALQEHTFERVGDPQTRHVDVRILSATHVNLGRAVAEGGFREDLYYRLRVVPIEIPPLRMRREDIEVLVHHFLPLVGRSRGRSLRLSPSVMRTFLSHRWPGNVREMQNALEYACAVCEGQTIHVADLPAEIRGDSDLTASLAPSAPPPPAAAPVQRPVVPDLPLSASERSEVERLLDALERSRFRRESAARLLGISRTTLWRKMKEYRLG